jgi:hypothetical protein
MVTFSQDTDYVLCASSSGTNYGAIHRVIEGKEVLKFGHQPMQLTTVDWTNSSSACLLGTMDGTVKVTTLIKV